MNVKEWLGEDNQIGIDIWEQKYRYDNETFDEWLDRVSGQDEDLKKLITEKKFLFGGRILSNRGLHKKGKKITYSNCYVISPPEDNLESIFETATKLARTYSYGGGCGIDISKLSPRGAKINNTAKETSGAVSFMELYSVVTGLIGQNGRRGALMISIDCNHPDLEEFIELKSDLDKVTSANISIRITDDFMRAVIEKQPYTLTYKREETGEVLSKEVNAFELFTKFAEMNWDYGEPALLYWDSIEQYTMLSNYEDFKFAGTNPCAEEPLPAGGSCLLGSLNLSAFITKNKRFNFEDFEKSVKIAVNALNNLLDEGLPLHPLAEQRESVRDWRQIGLGIMGLADMLIKMEVEYGSKHSLAICNEIATSMWNAAIRESCELAMKEGAFPTYHWESLNKSFFFVQNTITRNKDLIKQFGLRNSQLLTIAPTGTLSTMLGISGGIEPIYANFYTRTTKSLFGEDVTYKIYTPIVDKYMKENNLKDESELPSYFVTAQTLNYKDRIDMQSTWQKYIDASISSTVNVPNNFTVEEVIDLYIYAWEKGLKGITIFRDGCKRTGILNLDKTTEEQEIEDDKKLKWGTVLKSSDNLIGRKRTLVTGCGTLHCEGFFDPDTGKLMETFFTKGSKGGCNSFMVGLSRMTSLSARAGVDIDTIVDQLDSTIECTSYVVRKNSQKDTSPGRSCPMAIGRALKDMYDQIQIDLGFVELENNKPVVKKVIKATNPCPNCGHELKFEGGCNSCPECGWSKCD